MTAMPIPFTKKDISTIVYGGLSNADLNPDLPTGWQRFLLQNGLDSPTVGH